MIALNASSGSTLNFNTANLPNVSLGASTAATYSGALDAFRLDSIGSAAAAPH